MVNIKHTILRRLSTCWRLQNEASSCTCSQRDLRVFDLLLVHALSACQLSPECIHFLRSKFASIPINMPVSKPNGSDQRTKAKEVWRRATAVCFDVDSTLIQEEGIDKLADYCGAGEQVAEWYLNFVCGIASSSCWTASPTSLARSSCAAPGRRSRGNAYVHRIT